MNNTYRVKLDCPACGENLSFDKKKNGVSIHQTKIRKLYRHMSVGPCAIHNEDYTPKHLANAQSDADCDCN